MRVAVVNWTGRRAGGAESYIGLVVSALLRHGHDVFFWHEVDAPVDRARIDGLVEVASSCVSAAGLATALRALETWRPDVLFVQRLDNPAHEEALLGVAPGVFFAHDYYGTCISGAKAFKFPVVQPCARTFGPMCLVNYFPKRCGGLSPLTMFSEYRRQSGRLSLLGRYDSIVTLSEHMRREYLKHGFHADRVRHLPPVDPTPVTVPTTEREVSADRNSSSHASSIRLAFIGRIDLLKGLHVLLSALPAIRAAVQSRLVLTIAGDGPDIDRCRQLARTAVATLRDTEVEFLGWVSAKRCAEVLTTADVLVVPSLWPEPFGLVGIEARREGVPVAAFKVGGIPEWLEDGRNGALAPADPPTIAGLAAAVIRCLTSADIREGARDLAGRHAAGYSIEAHLDALLPILSAAAARNGAAELRL